MRKRVVKMAMFVLLLGTVTTSAALGSVVYEVWGGNTDYRGKPECWNYYYNIDKQDYVKLGESAGESKTFYGIYNFYVIAARERFLLDCVHSSSGEYPGTGVTGNTSDWENISGEPDGLFATVGNKDSGGTFKGFVVIDGFGNFTSITVISDLPAPSQTDLVIADTPPSTITVQPGDSVNVPVTVQNIGSSDAVPSDPDYFDVTLYIANSPQVDWDALSDTDECAEYDLTSLAAQTSHSETLTFTAPQLPGRYYLRAKADEVDSVQESNEDNNWGRVITLFVNSGNGGYGEILVYRYGLVGTDFELEGQNWETEKRSEKGYVVLDVNYSEAGKIDIVNGASIEYGQDYGYKWCEWNDIGLYLVRVPYNQQVQWVLMEDQAWYGVAGFAMIVGKATSTAIGTEGNKEVAKRLTGYVLADETGSGTEEGSIEMAKLSLLLDSKWTKRANSEFNQGFGNTVYAILDYLESEGYQSVDVSD